MTDERDKSASIVDDTVSRTYREIADERTPEHLDRAVMAEAARAARPRYARSRAWTRPLAWAATITLTVAIVLELTQVPEPDDAFFEQEAPAFADDASDQPAAAPAAAEAPVSNAAGRSNDVLPKAPGKTSLMQKTAAPMVTEADAEGRQRQAVTAETASEPAAPVDTAAFDVKDKELLRRADEMSEMRFSDAREEMAAPEQAARLQSAAPATAADVCAEKVRRNPQDWLECIRALEEAGMEAEAEAQRRLLQEAYPAFELP